MSGTRASEFIPLFKQQKDKIKQAADDQKTKTSNIKKQIDAIKNKNKMLNDALKLIDRYSKDIFDPKVHPTDVKGFFSELKNSELLSDAELQELKKIRDDMYKNAFDVLLTVEKQEVINRNVNYLLTAPKQIFMRASEPFEKTFREKIAKLQEDCNKKLKANEETVDHLNAECHQIQLVEQAPTYKYMSINY